MLEPAGTATLLVADATSRRRWKSVRRERMIRRWLFSIQHFFNLDELWGDD
jgi:hypothetical protein